MLLLPALAAYSRHFPIDIGKWRLHRFIDRRLDRRIATIRTRDGLRMRLDTGDFVQRTLYATGLWDEAVGREVRALRPGDLFVDCGANVGYFSLLAASRGARVIAFEPNPACRDAILHNAALNGFTIDVRAVALADKGGEGVLTVERDDHLGAGRLAQVGEAGIAVPLDTLDRQLAGQRPTLIKIDVEGAEIGVLEGAAETLAAGTRLVIEVSEYSLTRFGGSKEKLFALLRRYGYRGKLLGEAKPSTATDEMICFQFDAVFTRRAG